MSLLRKSPVENPCEASSFEEAFNKNHARVAFEHREAEALYADMVRDKDPQAESMNPDFWLGAQSANNRAYAIYREEVSRALAKVAERLGQEVPPPGFGALRQSGWKSFIEAWLRAAKTVDPSAIVYW